MGEINSGHQIRVMKLILVPSLITLGVTILRVVGELRDWSPLFFGKEAGGGGAIVGISWLPIFFGIYFALKLAEASAGPASLGRAFAFWGLGAILFVSGSYLRLLAFQSDSPVKNIAAVVLTAGAVLVQLWGWSSLAKVLFAYAYAARIPVLIVTFFAFRGKWGTHYDALPPDFVSKGFASDFSTWQLFRR
jgi:hypothetical protein